MAAIEWTGGTDGDATDGTNWVGAVAPGVGDIGVFNQGSVSVDPSLGNIAAIAGLEIYPGYSGALGASANKITTSIDTVKHFGHAALWLDDAAGLTDDVYIACARRDVIVNLGGVTMTNITLVRGNVTLAGDLGATTLLNVGFVSNVAQDVTLTVETNTNDITDLVISGGTTTLKKEAITIHMSAGLLTMPTGSSGKVLNLHQKGGTIRHNSKNDSVNITVAYVGGLLDLGQAAKTIDRLVRMPGGEFIHSPGLHTITVDVPLDAIVQAA